MLEVKSQFTGNRLLVIDWASLSYHMIWGMNSAGGKSFLQTKYQGTMITSDIELMEWRLRMISCMLEYIRAFNPMHIVLALEGKNGWRRAFVREWYEKHARVYYDSTSLYILADNRLHSVRKIDDASYEVTAMKMSDMPVIASKKSVLFGDMRKEKKDLLWKMTDAKGKPVFPVYKGQRSSQEWPFQTDKAFWMEYKDDFARELAPVFRARAVKIEGAEGDDVMYAAAGQWAKFDDVIVITRDSDMNQLTFPNVRLFDHMKCAFADVTSPEGYLSAKILSGDSSDNIHGMAPIDESTGFPKPKGIGHTTAMRMVNEAVDVHAEAVRGKWTDQYERNRNLIDLSCVPADVSSRIQAALAEPEPPMASPDFLSKYGVSRSDLAAASALAEYGYFCVRPENEVSREAFRGQELADKIHDAIEKASNPAETSDEFGDYLDSPGIDPVSDLD